MVMLSSKYSKFHESMNNLILNKITFLFLTFFICQSCNMKNGLGKPIKNGLIALDSLKVKDTYVGDAINFSSFDEYLKLVPDFNFEDKSKIPEIPYETQTLITSFEFGPDGYMPLSKINRNNFVAIIYLLPLSGDVLSMVTLTKSGKKINEIQLYFYDGIEELGSPYRKKEKCDYQIDKNLNIHYKHDASLLIKVDKSNTSLKDSILLDDFEEYYAKIDTLGTIIKIKK
jgi:hypothetical protein